MVRIDKIQYFNLPNCYRLANGTVEVVVTTDIAPRVIAYRFPDGENALGELGPDTAIDTEWGAYHIWGGHRLWHAPESSPRSYVSEDRPVPFQVAGDEIRLSPVVEMETGVQKEMIVKLAESGSRVTVVHRLTNRGVWPVELAPWGLTVMNGGGTTIVPNEPFMSHKEMLLPARAMVLWHYTNLSDARWQFGPRFTRLRSAAEHDYPQKAGFANKRGWAAYLREGQLFVKKFPYQDGEIYPDGGCNFETFTSGMFMEVESLGPMVKLEPGQGASHVENWHLHTGVESGDEDEALEASIAPLLSRVE